MAIDENDPRLKDMLRAIELGDLPEDLPPDPEDYDDMGGIKSLDRSAPSIKMASETGAEEFELELMGVINEYNDLKSKGDPAVRDISLDQYIDNYFSKKKMMEENRAMAMGGGMMRMGYAGGMKDPKDKENNLEDLPEGLKRDTTTYPLGQEFNDKLINRPDTKGMTILKLKELIEKRKKEKKKLAMGGIAGVL